MGWKYKWSSFYSCGCNTAAARHARHHERTYIGIDVIVVQVSLPHIFDQHVFWKELILNIGVHVGDRAEIRPVNVTVDKLLCQRRLLLPLRLRLARHPTSPPAPFSAPVLDKWPSHVEQPHTSMIRTYQ
jgi:hypothetical protein